MIRQPPRSSLDRSAAASDVYKRQYVYLLMAVLGHSSKWVKVAGVVAAFAVVQFALSFQSGNVRILNDFDRGLLFQAAAMTMCALGLNLIYGCLLYTSDAADERSSVDLGGRRIIKKKTTVHIATRREAIHTLHDEIHEVRCGGIKKYA